MSDKKYDEYLYPYRDIPESPIILDFSKCNGWYDVHKMLCYEFGMPIATDTNWDAFWDFARDTFDGRGKIIL